MSTDRIEALGAVDDALGALSWYPVAKKEFLDTIRSRVLLLVSVLFVAVFVLPVAVVLYTDLGPAAEAVSGIVIAGAPRLASVLIPLAAIAVAFAAVSGERQSGSLKLLLSQPFSRLDVVVGKVVGRLTAVVVPFVLAFVLRVLVALPKESVGDLGAQAAFLGLSVALAAVFVALAVGVSGATRTTNRSIGWVFGIYVYLFLFWNSLANGVGSLLVEFADVTQVTQYKAVLLVKLLNPTQAYKTLLASLQGTPQNMARVQMFGSVVTTRQGGIQAQMKQQLLAEELGESVPIYFSDWMAVMVLVAWLAVPLALGYYVFERQDL